MPSLFCGERTFVVRSWDAGPVQAADGGPVGFGGANLAQARLALMAAILKMRQYRCDCTDHEQVPGQPCRTAALLADLTSVAHSQGVPC